MVQRNRGRAELAAGLLVAIAVILTPLVGDSGLEYGMTVAAIYAIPAIGLNLLTATAGQVSFGQTAFLDLGAYGSAILTTRYGVEPYLALLLSAILCAAVCAMVGTVLLRLSGFYLAVGTFALALGIGALLPASTYFGSAEGIVGIPPLGVGTYSFALHPVGYYILAWLVCLLALGLYWSLSRSYLGRAWRTISLAEQVGQSVGMHTARLKVGAFIIAGVLAGLSGSIYAEFTGFVGPDTFDISVMVNLFFILFIGGQRSYVGPLLGAAVLILAPQYIPALQSDAQVVFSLALLLIMILFPAGALGDATGMSSIRSLLRNAEERVKRTARQYRGEKPAAVEADPSMEVPKWTS